MEKQILTKQMLEEYKHFLCDEEKSLATVEKYMRDITYFYSILPDDKGVDKETVISFKQSLLLRYKLSSANSILVAVNGLFTFLEWTFCKVKTYKCQRELVRDSDRELTKAEYLRLVSTADIKGKTRLSLILQSIGATGIRIGELAYITKEAVVTGNLQVHLKGKNRTVILPKKLSRKLAEYCRKEKIVSGPVFVTRTGKPVDRSNIWTEMKNICYLAGVSEKKVFPHNLRHLFARVYYEKNRDIIHLADILGHSNVNTTRIYTSVSRKEHERVLARMGLVF